MTPRSRAATALCLLTLLLGHAQAERAGDIARGRYLVAMTGCADCHTPLKPGPKGPEPDLARGLSGHPEGLALPPAPAPQGPWIWGGAGSNTAFWGPWGISYAINLTPDPDTGLGHWSAEQFIGALRTGQHRGAGRPIAPPMPWQAYGQMSDEDLRAMFAYLQSLPPLRNAVPAYQPPPAR
ncbi:MAG: c-type cytochrome [Roseateles sp.]|nr:MAG: c-type cytochrome [Roseateles sp.]